MNQLRSFISGMMTDENLVIMTGLGTSLCVTDWLDKKLAPTMGDLWIVAEKTWRKVIKETWEGDDDVPQDRLNINDLC